MLYDLLLMMCLGSSSKGAIGKCTSLFKFVEGIIKERVQRPTIAHDVDASSGPSSSLYQRGLQIDEELRKRRAADDASVSEEPDR